MSRRSDISVPLIALVAAFLPVSAAAQTIAYGDVSQGSEEPSAGAPEKSARISHRRGGAGGHRVSVEPYIEVAQIVTADLSPGNDVLTYSRVAAGIDASAVGQRNGVSVSARYERHFAWSNKGSDGDSVSGIANGYATVAPGVQIQAGALATRTSIGTDGSAVLGPVGDDDTVTQIYSVYAGPSIATHAGDVGISASYRFGYTKVEQPNAYVAAPGGNAVDVFDDSTVHAASVQAGVKPHTVLPIGVGVGGSYYREDISNLDQRVEDKQAQATATVELTPAVQVSGAVGYEKVQVSSRDAVRDANGLPVIGSDGRYVTDKSTPRILGYDVDGLTWDAGVMWRPSRRTSLTAHVGRRYGSTSVSGTFAYAPNERTAFNLMVYDNVAGFGGQVNRALAELPTDFTAVRNPLTGDLTGCVSSLEDGSCLAGALGSVRSSTFRARGVAASYALSLGRISAGLAAGYDRRKFIGAPGTVLAAANGVVDENYWLSGFFDGRIDRHSSFSTTVVANWIDSGGTSAGNVTALSATAAYNRGLTDHISASAALGIEGLTRKEPLDDLWSASAFLGVRYSF